MHAEPLVDRAVQQTMGKDEKEDGRDQRDAEEGRHHFRLEARTEVLLLPLDVELQQNAQQDEGKDDEGQNNDNGKNLQQDRFFRTTGADETQVQGRLAPSQEEQDRNEDQQGNQKTLVATVGIGIHVRNSKIEIRKPKLETRGDYRASPSCQSRSLGIETR